MDSNKVLEEYEEGKWDIDLDGGLHYIKEGNEYKRIKEILQNYNLKLNESKVIKLLERGFLLELINLSPKFKYPKEFESKTIIRTILKMQNTNIDSFPYSKKTASFYGVRYHDRYFRFFSITFRKLGKITKSKSDFTKIIQMILTNESLENINSFSRQMPMKLKREIFCRDKYTCNYCGWKNGLDNLPDRILSIDHIVPLAYGGTTKKENLVTSCLQCNIKKNDKLLEHLLRKALKDKQINKISDKI